MARQVVSGQGRGFWRSCKLADLQPGRWQAALQPLNTPLLTSLRVQLPQHLSDDLAHTLQGLQIVLRLVILLPGLADLLPQGPHPCIQLPVLQQLVPVL